MTFSFDTSLSTDKDSVRFNIGDTSDEGHYLEDETIDALLIALGAVGDASIACIEYIITQLSQPDFKLDWLEVSNKDAIEGFEKILTRLRIKFAIYDQVPVTSVSAVPLYRADSNQEDGDYDGV